MNILALDTCTEFCFVAMLHKNKWFERIERAERGHSELIISMIDALFVEANTTIAKVHFVAFGRGPGLFTGVRVGVGVAQGIAFARNIPVISISSLAATAQSAIEKSHTDYISVATDARMGEVYGANFRVINGLVTSLDDERVCPPDEFKPITQKIWMGAGAGWVTYSSILTDNFAGQLEKVDATCLPQATSIIKLAQQKIKYGEILPAELALPVYIRNNVAKKKKVPPNLTEKIQNSTKY